MAFGTPQSEPAQPQALPSMQRLRVAQDGGAPQHEFTNLEVGEAVSRELNLPVTLTAVAGLAAKLRDFVNGSAEYRSKGLQAGGIRSLIVTNLTPEIAALLDPAQATKIRAEQEAKANVTSADGARTLGEGYRLVNGVWVRADKGDKSEAALALRDGQSRTAAYARELNGKASPAEVAPGTGYSWLSPANQNIPGFNRALVAGAANFLKGIGFTREQVNEGARHMVHLQEYRSEIQNIVARQQDIDRRRARGENVDADQTKLDEYKKTTGDRMTPEKRREFELLPVIRKQDRQRVTLEGRQAATHDSDQATLVSDNDSLGATKQIERDHQKTVAAVTRTPKAGQSDEDLIAGLIATKTQSPGAPPIGRQATTPNKTPAAAPATASKQAGPGEKAGGDKPAATAPTLAANTKAMKMTV